MARSLRLASIAVLAGLAWSAASGAAMAHHSFAMFDTEHPIEISGTVKEFRFVNPHTILIVEVKGQDGSIKNWILESGAPGLQAREGMTAHNLQPGDEVVVKISPLHSGAQGGSYQLPQIRFKDGRPVAVPR